MAIADILRKLFGSKADRDLKQIKPVLDLVLAAYEKIDKLSDDELRARSAELREKLRECEVPFERRIEEIKLKMDEDIPVNEKEDLATESDKLVKEEDEQIEKAVK
jgi:preprotein translocase subunit SecA